MKKQPQVKNMPATQVKKKPSSFYNKKKDKKESQVKKSPKGDKKKPRPYGVEKAKRTSWCLDWEEDNYEPGDVCEDDVDAADDESDESPRTSISPEGTVKKLPIKAPEGNIKKKAKATFSRGNLGGDNQKRGTPSHMTKSIALLAMLEVDSEKKVEEKRKMMEKDMRMKSQRMRIEACLKTREENEKDLEAELKGSRRSSGSRASSSRT